MNVDIVCVGFGPASGGFLTTLSNAITAAGGESWTESKTSPGMPLQVICYERADDISFGVSGVVTMGRSIRGTFPDIDLSQIPMACDVKHEKVLYLLDPVGASRRSWPVRLMDKFLRLFKFLLPYEEHAVRLPYIPPFLQKHGGFLLSIGQFNQWVGSQVMGAGAVQIWPGMPVAEPLFDSEGVRLVDQGVEKTGKPAANFMPGMDIQAALTVVGDGPVGPVGEKLDLKFGLPEGNHQKDWAVGMKMVVELPENCPWEAGTVIHTMGYPEPEIFGFLYVYPNRLASLGIFVPSWMKSPVRTCYRYLQYWMMHPYLWRYLNGGTMRSWGAKTLGESSKRGEPFLAGDGYARIGEGSGSTNVLTGSGVDEAWATGVMLAESVIELLKSEKPFTKENLDATYVKRRRASWVEKEGKIAQKARDGFHLGFLPGVMGMGLAGMTNGILNMPARPKYPYEGVPSAETYFKGKISPEEIENIRKACVAKQIYLNGELLERAGWPAVPYDGKLLVSHQDALLMGGKVQAPDGYADHVLFLKPEICENCHTKLCVEICSGQAITLNPEGGVPLFDREKCIHCGACEWNCVKPREGKPGRTNIDFVAGTGGLHSAEN